MKTILQLFKELFNRFPWHFMLLFGFVFLQAILSALSVIAVAPIADLLLERSGNDVSEITKVIQTFYSNSGNNLELIHVFIFFGIVTIINSLTGIFIEYSVLRIKYDVLIHLLTDTIGKFFRSKYLFFSQGDMGVLLNSFQQEVDKVGNTFGSIARLFANLLQAIIFLAVPFTLSPKLTILFITIAALISAPLWLLHRLSYGLGKQNTETANRVAGILHESLTAAKLIISFGRQNKTINYYKQAIKQHAKVSVKFQTLIGGVSKLFNPLGVVAALITIYISYIEGMPLGTMAMVLFSLNRLVPVIGLLLSGKTIIEGFVPSYEQMQNLRSDAEAYEVINGTKIFNKLTSGIELKNISFNFPERELTLKDVNINIKKGSFTALVGKSGSGKTTIVDLILGLYEEKSGGILLNGHSLNSYDINTYREKLGYVPQEPQLFNTSIRENFLWSVPHATEKDMWSVCRLSNAEEFVKELPNKLDTILGDRGVRLSGGQRQRLALARALIRKPELLILDEATSSLDTESEGLIQESIDNLAGDMTIVVIAHRLSTIRNADYLYVLEKGEIVERGTFNDLSVKKSGRLSDMIVKQAL